MTTNDKDENDGITGASVVSLVVDQLCDTDGLSSRCRKTDCAEPLPSIDAILETTEVLREILFPGYIGRAEITPDTMRFHVGRNLDIVQHRLRTQIVRSLAFVDPKEDTRKRRCKAEALTLTFLKRLPNIKEMLASDAQAAYEGDPAATSPDEAVFCYPGLRALTKYRIAHELHVLSVPLLPRIITELAHSITGIDIHPGATIGRHFFIDHGTGVVIGETCVIGDRVRIYQGVTLGAKSFMTDDNGNLVKGIARHPIIEDDVVIYSGATVLGRITIGKGSMIGGNVWLTQSVPPQSRITI